MSNVFQFPKNEIFQFLEMINKSDLKEAKDKKRRDKEKEEANKKWEDRTEAEKINLIIKNNWYLTNYIEEITFERYQKQFDNSIQITPYELWVRKQVESGRIK